MESPKPESPKDPLEARDPELIENTIRTREALNDLRSEIQTGVPAPRQIEKISREISEYNHLLERVKVAN